jgi:hypothetical protein
MRRIGVALVLVWMLLALIVVGVVTSSLALDLLGSVR